MFDPTLPMDAPVPGSSFTAFLTARDEMQPITIPPGVELSPPHGTTVLALRFGGGVVMAGDRRATEGHLVAHRHIRKVFISDHFSAVAIAGVAGVATEMVKLFQVELEHYEKIEGHRLSLEGKASFLARLVRNQLPMAMQGLVVVPLFAGYDHLSDVGRLYTFDVVGGRYEERDFGSTGSGARLAKSYLRTAFDPDMDMGAAIDLAVRALVAASVEDTATGGPDLLRDILPTVVAIDAEGALDVEEDRIRPLAQRAVETIR